MAAGQNPFSALRDVAREQRDAERDESAWVARRAGTDSPSEAKALADRAASDAYAAHMHALTEPLDAQGSAALEARIAGMLATPAAPKGASVHALGPRRTLRNLSFVGATLAVAAAVLLVVARPSSDLVLPPYEGQLLGVDRAVRAGESVASEQRQVLSRGAQVRVRVRPLEPLAREHGALGGKVFVAQGSALESVAVEVRVAESGAAELSAPYDQLFAARKGDWDVLLFVGDVESLPEDAAEARALTKAAEPAVRMLRFPVTLAR